MEIKLSHKNWKKVAPELSDSEIMKLIGVGPHNAICIRKKRSGWKWAYYLWWEDKEKWFLNKAREEDEKWPWYIAKDTLSTIGFLRRQKYEFYTQE